MMTYLRLLTLVLATLLCYIAGSEAACDECYSAHACIGRNQFQVCANGIKNTNQNFTCPSETAVCTRYGQICFEEGGSITPACGDVTKCADCAAVDDGGFACVSRTTFRQCFNGVPYGNLGSCPNKFLCSIEGAKTGQPCVNQCNVNADNDICDRNANAGDDGGSTTTTVFPPTPTPPSSTTIVAPTITPGDCSGGTGRYAHSNDTACTSYIYCYWQGGVIRSADRNCPTSNPYFNATSTTCGTVKPPSAGCI